MSVHLVQSARFTYRVYLGNPYIHRSLVCCSVLLSLHQLSHRRSFYARRIHKGAFHSLAERRPC